MVTISLRSPSRNHKKLATEWVLTLLTSKCHFIGFIFNIFTIKLPHRVTTRSSNPVFKKNQFSAMRRFSDFLGLHDILVEKYLRSGRIIPPAPQKNIIGTTKVKMSSSQSQTEPGVGIGMEWVENRRAALERFLSRTAQHPVLCVDPDFVNFLQSDEELPRSVNTAALSGAGVMRLFNKVGETVNKITYKMDENDPVSAFFKYLLFFIIRVEKCNYSKVTRIFLVTQF